MPTAEQLNEAAIRNIGRNPQWKTPTDTANRPPDANAGKFIGGSPKTLVMVALRADVSKRAATYTNTSFDAAATYTLTLGGTPINVVTPATPTALLDGLVTAIRGNPTTNALVTVTPLDSDGNDSSVSGNPTVAVAILGNADAHYTIARSETGTGVSRVEAEPNGASMKVYLLADGEAENDASPVPTFWASAENTTFTLTDENYAKRFDTAGFKRMAVRLFSLTGSGDTGVVYTQPTVKIGPAIDE